MTRLFIIAITLFCYSCNNANSANEGVHKHQDTLIKAHSEKLFKHSSTPVSRAYRLKKLQSKSDSKEPILIHIRVPLCDYLHQGVVGVGAKLASGLNLKTNLYWGAGYGISTHFSRSSKWRMESKKKAVSSSILERLVFKHKKLPNVILVADAFRGDSMKACLSSFYNSLAGIYSDSIFIDSSYLSISNPDLVIFNGHNGLMDCDIELPLNKDSITEDAMVIACISKDYFQPYFSNYGSYPALMTNHLLAPEAYILDAAIDEWLKFSNTSNLKYTAGDAYHKIQKCGTRGARNLFSTGW